MFKQFEAVATIDHWKRFREKQQITFNNRMNMFLEAAVSDITQWEERLCPSSGKVFIILKSLKEGGGVLHRSLFSSRLR